MEHSDEARRLGLRPIVIRCDGEDVLAFVDFVPRVGEVVILEDGSAATVRKVRHEVVASAGFATLVPTVAGKRGHSKYRHLSDADRLL
jgi:hypothetical protein